ncbi:MAG: DUF1015 domain-containing protein [Acidimicrobiia bacterium]|nr:DUF1015 domain-containing protein [Acidimicrobiia bacterium]
MPDLAPFRGLRYADRAALSAVTAPPYDVIEDDERVALEESDPHNAVRLILPRAGAAGDAYASAAATLAAWRADKVLVLDQKPSFTVYRMTAVRTGAGEHHTIGVIGALGLPERDGMGDILPHERTLPKARSDRLALLRATRANLDPIWALSLAPGLTDLLADVPCPAVAIDGDGTRHEFGVLDDPARLDAIRSLVAGAPAVLADGHHRFETACAYRDEAPDTRGADAIMTLVVELADDQLDVHPIHRIVRKAPPKLRDRLAATCVVMDAGPNTPAGVGRLVEGMARRRAVGLVDAKGLALVVPIDAALTRGLASEPSALHGVDAARCDAVVRPALGDAALTYRNDAKTVAAVVREGGADAAVLLRGVSVEQIRVAAAAGIRMPEKTTFFAPKPRTGIAFRALDD